LNSSDAGDPALLQKPRRGLTGETDIIMGYDLQVLKSLEQKLPVIAVAGLREGRKRRK
jgi:hypothetical protein